MGSDSIDSGLVEEKPFERRVALAAKSATWRGFCSQAARLRRKDFQGQAGTAR
jgi:hypothetical protein